MKVIRRVMANAQLEEIEILQPIIGLDFSRQLSVKRLAIESSMLGSLPRLAELEELAVTNMQGDAVSFVESFTQITRLTLSGSYLAIHRVDSNKLTHLKTASLEVHSYETEEIRQFESSSLRRGVALSSLFHADTSLTLYPNNTWTNQTVIDAVCNSPNLTSLTIWSSVSAGWFTFPTCISSYNQLSYLSCLYCQVPNMSAIPNNIAVLSLSYLVGGHWNNGDAGTSTDPATADFFDWSWLPSKTKLTSFSMPGGGVNGTLPNQYNHSKLQSLGLGVGTGRHNSFSGTIAPDWFLKYPSMIAIDLSQCGGMTGTVPYYALEKVEALYLATNNFTHWPTIFTNSSAGWGFPSKLNWLNLDSNQFVQIPSEENFVAMPKLTHLYIGDNPNLAVPFPNIFKANRTSANLQIISASGCQFTGPLPEIPQSQLPFYTSGGFGGMLFSANNFSGTIPSSWANVSATWLQLSGNPGINGTVATIDPSTGLVINKLVAKASIFNIDSPALTGVMLNLTALQVESLQMNAPNVDYCYSARQASSNDTILFPAPSASFRACYLTQTNASYCAWAYPSICQVSEIPVAPPSSSSPPSSSPNSPNAPSNTPSSNPGSTPSSTPTTGGGEPSVPEPKANSDALIPSIAIASSASIAAAIALLL